MVAHDRIRLTGLLREGPRKGVFPNPPRPLARARLRTTLKRQPLTYRSAVDLDRAKSLLQRERERIERELGELRAGHGDDGELSGVDQHNADAGTELFEEERDRSLIDRLEYELKAVARAEKRTEQGGYGLSVESGQPIPDERLEAVPHAERTVEEQSRIEARHRNS